MRFFSKEKFIEVEGKETYLENKGWVDACDGLEVVERKNESENRKTRRYLL